MFVTINGTHWNMAYLRAFAWVDGELKVVNDRGTQREIADPDKALYLQMCEKAGVEPVKSAEEDL